MSAKPNIVVVYEDCGDIYTKRFASESELADWLDNSLNKAIVIRSDSPIETEDHT